ncbi:MAG: hypothetical protein AAB875_00875, partial [Patescibacteria group bacterium]
MVVNNLQEAFDVMIGEPSPGIGRGCAPHMYWKRPLQWDSPGWVVLGPTNAESFQKYIRMGFMPLFPYGQHITDTKEWRTQLDPYRKILENGGAKEFPVDQVIELGWQRKAPTIKGKSVEFPQIEGVMEFKGRPITNPSCEHCTAVFITDAMLSKHTALMHANQAQSTEFVRTFGKLLEGIKPDSQLGELIQVL